MIGRILIRDRCSNLFDIRDLFQYREKSDWVLVCPNCWQEVSPDNPRYRYGDTWKAKQ